jgi:hypothetical protein
MRMGLKEHLVFWVSLKLLEIVPDKNEVLSLLC